jgi:tetratricopeptide (TPR) repeat protein
LFDNKQLEAAEDAASRAFGLVTEEGQEFFVCQLHRILGKISGSKGENEKAIHHLETALGIASPPGWHEELFWIHYSLAELYANDEKPNDANTHIKQAKSHALDDTFRLGRAMDMQANVWFLQLRLQDAKSEALCALKMYEGCGAVYDVGICREFLQMMEKIMKVRSTSSQGELL